MLELVNCIKGEQMNNFLKIKHSVNYSEIDHKNVMRLDALVSEIQKITAFHSKEMGIDGDTTAKKCNAYWVVSKYKLKINSLPHVYDQIEIETWPTTVSTLRFNRDYTVSNEKGVCAVATSEWCTLDMQTNAIRRTNSICYPFDLQHRLESSGAGEFSKKKEQTEKEDFCYSHKVLFVDIDSNQHTNNIAYVRMTLNTFSPEEFDNIKLDEFEIYFLSQTFYGDSIDVYKKKTDYGYYVEGKKDGKTVFVSILM